jgi:surface protein
MAVGSFKIPISSSSDEWVRPTDWLAMPTGITSSNQTFVGLHAVFPSGQNYVAFLFTTSAGQYQVDWGDGTVTLHNSNTIAQYEYDFATISSSTLTSRGYKQSMITVTAVSGNLLTCDLQRRFVTSPVQNQPYASGFLDCILSMPNASGGVGVRSIVLGGNLGTVTVSHAFIERFEIKTIGNLIDLISLFQNMLSLQSVPLFNTANVTRMLNMFQGCQSLQTIPLFNTGNVTDMAGMFGQGYSLKSIPLLNTQNVTTMTGMFSTCGSLKTIPLLNTQNVLTMDSMFFTCRALQTIPLLNTIKVTNMLSMFQNCNSLKSLPLLNTGNVTNMLQMFFACSSLETFPLWNTSKVTNMGSMIQNCASLNYLPALPTTLVTFYSNFADGCRSLNKIEMAFNQTIVLTNCQLSRTALVEIFTNLVDRSATTSANINISGNWGATALTAGDRLIATAKNWTITG